jgi:sec-independent protein translocase protein TatB
MFDIDAGKLLIIGVIALVVLGPKELPRVLRQIGNLLGKMRRMAAEFQGQFAEAMRQSEMEELKKSVEKVADSARVDINYDPIAATDREIRAALEDKPASAHASSSASSPEAGAADPALGLEPPSPPQIIDAAAFGPGTTPSGPPAPAPDPAPARVADVASAAPASPSSAAREA